MGELAAKQNGYLGMESVRDEAGLGITVSYLASLQAIEVWKANVDHKVAQVRGKTDWYAAYAVRIAKVERAYAMSPSEPLVPPVPV